MENKVDTNEPENVYFGMVKDYRAQMRLCEAWIIFFRESLPRYRHDIDSRQNCHSIINQLLQEKVALMKNIKYYLDLGEAEKIRQEKLAEKEEEIEEAQDFLTEEVMGGTEQKPFRVLGTSETNILSPAGEGGAGVPDGDPVVRRNN